MAYWVILGLVALVFGHGNLALSGVLFAGGTAIAYVASVWRHPNRTCRTCGGTGRHRGAMFTWATRPCTSCGGQSRHRRLGAQMFRGGTGEKVWAERAAGDAGKRKNAPR